MAWLFHKQCALCCDQLLHSGASVPIYSFIPSVFWLFQVSPPQEQQPLPGIKKKIIKECCEHFWGCPVQRQELDSLMLVSHFQLRIFCFSDSNMI